MGLLRKGKGEHATHEIQPAMRRVMQSARLLRVIYSGNTRVLRLQTSGGIKELGASLKYANARIARFGYA